MKINRRVETTNFTKDSQGQGAGNTFTYIVEHKPDSFTYSDKISKKYTEVCNGSSILWELLKALWDKLIKGINKVINNVKAKYHG